MSKVQLVLGTPSDKQIKFLEAKTKHVGFGGARGGGKSWAVQNKAIRLCLRYKGIKCLIVRRTYPELMNNHIMPLQDVIPRAVARYNKTEKLFKFFNGSTIKFGYCNNDKDLDQYQGAEYDIIFLDEATQLQEMWIKKITACLRGANDFPKRIMYTCNPGGASHGYFKRLFIDKKYEEGEDPTDYTFIQSLVTDNKALMAAQPDYIKQLEALPPKIRDAWLYGRWDIYEGQFFEEFRETPDIDLCHKAGITPEEALEQRRYTHVIEPFEIPRYWTIMRAYDFGHNRPWALEYFACSPDGVLYNFLEVYGWNGSPNEGNKMTPDEQFAYIEDLERQHPWLKGRKIVDSVADPSIWDASRGESTAETASRHGIYFSPADNSRINGWMMLRYYFQFTEDGTPRMYFFNTCKNAIRTIPLMMFSETHPEDLDTDLEDHICDTLRYMAMSRPIKPVVPVERKIILSDPLDQFKNKF